MPILSKLYSERKTDDFIDINDCLTGTFDQNVIIIQELTKSDFALIKEDRKFNMNSVKPLTIKYSAKIQPLGIDYIEKIKALYQKANAKIPPVGFKPHN